MYYRVCHPFILSNKRNFLRITYSSSQNISEGTVYSKRDFWFFDNFGRLAPPEDDAPPRPFELAIAARFLSALVDPFTNWPPIFGLVPSGAFPLSASCSFENFPFAFASRRACAAFSSRFFFWKMRLGFFWFVTPGSHAVTMSQNNWA